MKSLYKWLLGLVVVLYIVLGCNGVKADAAYTDEGVYYPDLWTEVDWGEYESQKETLKAQYVDMIVVGSGNYFTYHLSNGQKHLFEQKSNDVLYAWLKPDSHYIGVEYGVVKYCILRNNSASVYWEGVTMVGSTYDYRGSSTLCYLLPHSNMLYEPEPVDLTFVNIEVNGTNYTVSEPYPYYLALKNPQGSIYLLFSDTPFTGIVRDAYNWRFDVSPTANVVCYSYFPGYTEDFIGSRSVSVGFDSFVTKSTTDYFCNYRIHYTDNLLYVFLPVKSFFNEVDYDLETLCLNMPDELKEKQCFIIFRQTSEKAYDNRIIFYGWDSIYAELFINSANSQICAIKNRKMVSDYITAYYDESTSEWVISSDVVLGATTDRSFSIPKVYYTNSTLYISDSEWYNTGQIVEMASLDPPPFSENSEDSEENSDDGLFAKFFSGLGNVLKHLFVPSNGYFSRQLASIQEHFAFWTSVRDTANVFVDFLEKTDFSEPPKIEIDLSTIKSSVSYGGKVFIIDLSWYEPYKESVDVIISSILWLVFIWNTYKNLPNIIGGIGGGVQATADILNDEKGGK